MSGDKSCFQQMYGTYSGCFREDIKWVFKNGNVGEAGGEVESWGKCAGACKKSQRCDYWTWASTSCSNCIPKECTLFDGTWTIDQGARAENPTEESHLGYISGLQSCVDIDYVERDRKGCLIRDVKWVFPDSTDPRWSTNIGFAGGILNNWAECQKECQKKPCDYWTYLGTTNTLVLDNHHHEWKSNKESCFCGERNTDGTCIGNCIESNCILFNAIQLDKLTGLTGETENPRDEAEIGSISGFRECEWKVVDVPDGGHPGFEVGSCKVGPGNGCESQEVPGYRC